MQGVKIKQLCFNELTQYPLCTKGEEEHSRVDTYAKTLRSIIKDQKHLKVLYEKDLSKIFLADNSSLREFCKSNPRLNGVQLILSTCKFPYNYSKDTEINDRYNNTLVSVDMQGKQELSLGLTAAYVYDVPSVGFYSDMWNKIMYEVHISYDEIEKEEVLPCLTRPEDASDNRYNEWVERHSNVELKETPLSPTQKGLSLSDDHGKDILKKHAKRLLNSEYVVEVLMSLPFAPRCKRYINETYQDGTIDIVLFWETPKCSMRIKTTGRNMSETKEIAEILRKRYGQG